MARRHNQYRNRQTRRMGSEEMDFEDKARVVKIMEGHGYRCGTNKFLLTPRFDVMPDAPAEAFVVQSTVPESMLRKWKLSARPDITCYDLEGNPVLIIEIDGKYHRNFDHHAVYDELGVPYIQINKEHCDVTGTTWEDWIVSEARRKNIEL